MFLKQEIFIFFFLLHRSTVVKQVVPVKEVRIVLKSGLVLLEREFPIAINVDYAELLFHIVFVYRHMVTSESAPMTKEPLESESEFEYIKLSLVFVVQQKETKLYLFLFGTIKQSVHYCHKLVKVHLIHESRCLPSNLHRDRQRQRSDQSGTYCAQTLESP